MSKTDGHFLRSRGQAFEMLTLINCDIKLDQVRLPERLNIIVNVDIGGYR